MKIKFPQTKKILLLCVILSCCSLVAKSKGGDNPPPPEPCPETETAFVTLLFSNCMYSDRDQSEPGCNQIPSLGCDPALNTGTANPTADPLKWYLRIIVEGDVDVSCSTRHTEINPTSPSGSYTWPITVPKMKNYTVTVEFYEGELTNCTTTNRNGRAKYSYKYTTTGPTAIFAKLKYEGTF